MSTAHEADGFVDAGPVRRHLQALRSAGEGYKQLAARTGVGDTTLRSCAGGTSRTVRTSTAAAVLAVPLPAPAPAPQPVPAAQEVPPGYVDGTETRRRVQAMCWQGFTTEAMARALWVRECRLREVAEGAGPVPSDFRDRVVSLYRRWHVANPVSYGVSEQDAASARAHALRSGYAPPGAWETIDDPACVPDVGKVDQGPQRARRVTAQQIRRVLAGGVDKRTAAKQLGLSKSTLDRRLREPVAASARPS